MSPPNSLILSINKLLRDPRLRFVFAALKGLRNGAVYGTRIRAPHAFVMTFLFAKGKLLDKLRLILRLTYLHARNLATFVFSYKLLCGGLEKIQGQRYQYHSFLSAFVVGGVVFGKNNPVNMQINLYLLSRIVTGLARVAVKRNYIPEPRFHVFPWFAAVVWGVVLWLFEYERDTLQPSLRSSMTYLYDDSNYWTTLKDFLFVNKL